MRRSCRRWDVGLWCLGQVWALACRGRSGLQICLSCRDRTPSEKAEGARVHYLTCCRTYEKESSLLALIFEFLGTLQPNIGFAVPPRLDTTRYKSSHVCWSSTWLCFQTETDHQKPACLAHFWWNSGHQGPMILDFQWAATTCGILLIQMCLKKYWGAR